MDYGDLEDRSRANISALQKELREAKKTQGLTENHIKMASRTATRLESLLIDLLDEHKKLKKKLDEVI